MGPTTERAEPTSSRRGVRPIVEMEVVSGIGDGVFWVGLASVLLGAGAGAGGFALAALVRLGPRALLSAPATALADRFPRRATLIVLDLARAVCMAAVAVLTALDVSSGTLFFPIALSYTIAAPYRPAITAALPLVAGERDLAAANARVSTVRQTMTFVGPLVGALVVATSDAVVAFAVNASTFVVAAWLIARIDGLGGGASRSTSSRERRDTTADRAWRDTLATPGLAVVGWSVFVMYVVRGAELVVYPLMAVQLGLGDGGIGILTGAIGLGAIAAMPVASRASDRGRPHAVVLGALAATAVPLLVVAVVTSSVAACLALVVLGGSVVVFEVVSVVSLQRLADHGSLARVFGVVHSASNGGKLAGAVVAPALVAWFGADGALVALALTVVALALGGWPALRSLTTAIVARSKVLQPTADVLASLALFDGASATALQRLAATVELLEVPAGAEVIRQGDDPDDLYVVRAGEVDATIGEVVVNTVRADGWFGEIGLIQRVPRTATVTARTDATLWRIPGDAFLAALGDVASMPTALIDEMGARLRRTAEITG